MQLAHLATDEEIGSNGLVEIQHLTEETIRNLRRLIRDLRQLYLEDLGLVSALEMLVRETQETRRSTPHLRKVVKLL